MRCASFSSLNSQNAKYWKYMFADSSSNQQEYQTILDLSRCSPLTQVHHSRGSWRPLDSLLRCRWLGDITFCHHLIISFSMYFTFSLLCTFCIYVSTRYNLYLCTFWMIFLLSLHNFWIYMPLSLKHNQILRRASPPASAMTPTTTQPTCTTRYASSMSASAYSTLAPMDALRAPPSAAQRSSQGHH